MFTEDNHYLEMITPKVLREAFTCWQQARKLPSSLFQSQLLAGSPNQSPVEREMLLYDTLYALVWEQLQKHRLAVGFDSEPHPPETLVMAKQQIAWDFSTHNRRCSGQLLAWSALFHRYLLLVPISTKELAQATGASDRQFRRHIENGFRYLARVVQRLEWQTTQRVQQPLVSPQVESSIPGGTVTDSGGG